MTSDKAAIVITTLCRYEHFVRCIESLRRNGLASETELYIGVDYPTKQSHVDGNTKIRNYLAGGLEGFKEAHIYLHDENKGPRGNCAFLLNEVFKTHERFVFTEDDNTFSCNFLEFINKCLDRFEHDDSVLEISGYFFPILVQGEEKLVKTTIFSAWGFAGWKEKEIAFQQSLNRNEIDRMFSDIFFMRKLSRKNPFLFVEFIKNYFGYSGCMFENGELQIIDLVYSLYMAYYEKFTVVPTITKVRNGGNDGSGVNCVDIQFNDKKNVNNRNYNYAIQEYDLNRTYDAEKKQLILEDEIMKSLDAFLGPPLFEKMKCCFAYLVYKVCGKTKTELLINRLCRKRKR